ncbi:MAG TPA: hypothetical protein VK672_02945 [Solirubrobacteraceae bacterium]|nr:hypothetical protein [Solirubrobacteraceae bacterium]
MKASSNDPTTPEQTIARRLNELYQFVCEAAANNEQDYARYGGLNSIVVSLRQPLAVAHAVASGRAGAGTL